MRRPQQRLRIGNRSDQGGSLSDEQLARSIARNTLFQLKEVGEGAIGFSMDGPKALAFQIALDEARIQHPPHMTQRSNQGTFPERQRRGFGLELCLTFLLETPNAASRKHACAIPAVLFH